MSTPFWWKFKKISSFLAPSEYWGFAGIVAWVVLFVSTIGSATNNGDYWQLPVSTAAILVIVFTAKLIVRLMIPRGYRKSVAGSSFKEWDSLPEDVKKKIKPVLLKVDWSSPREVDKMIEIVWDYEKLYRKESAEKRVAKFQELEEDLKQRKMVNEIVKEIGG